MDKNEQINDTFHGIQLTWRMLYSQIQMTHFKNPSDPYGITPKTEIRSLELSFHKKHKLKVINEYLPYILEKSKLIKEGKKTLKIFTTKRDGGYSINGWNPWQPVNLDHPATFDTLAMESKLKMEIMEDLERFVKRKDYYRKVGKARKRGYLLFGPPGTGKSSLIAAMANFLKFDIYDLELADIKSNSELRTLLISRANQSILVVEDIDCSIELQDRLAKGETQEPMEIDYYGHNRRSTVTLSGLLNFIDGLWSSCGDERIIVFTTNHKDRLDPALLRPGRMDMHIHMSYCTPCGFKMLASNYLEITDHPLFTEIEILIETKTVTPAEVAEQLMKNEEPDITLRSLIEFLEAKKENEDFVIDKDDGGSPTDDSGGDDSDASENGEEKEKPIKKNVKKAPSSSKASISSGKPKDRDNVSKKRKAKKKKDPNAPKKALSGFMFFSNSERDNINRDNPGIKFTDIGRLLGEKWRNMSAEEKELHEAQAQVNKKRYQDQLTGYKNPQPIDVHVDSGNESGSD